MSDYEQFGKKVGSAIREAINEVDVDNPDFKAFQRVIEEAFPGPERDIMTNLVGWLCGRAIANGGDPEKIAIAVAFQARYTAQMLSGMNASGQGSGG